MTAMPLPQRNTVPIGPLGPWLPQRSELLDVTPEQAKVILENYNSHNRRLRPVVIKAVIAALSSDQWVVNGETIIFGWDANAGTGVLLDGQNRLTGCINAQKTISSWIVFGQDPQSFTSIDRGSSRNLADDFSILGESNTPLLAAMAKLAYTYSTGVRAVYLVGSNNSSSRSVIAYLEENPGLRDSLIAAKAIASKFPPVPGRIIGSCHYLFGQKSQVARDDYFEKLSTGADMDAGHPVLVARERLFQERMKVQGSMKGSPAGLAYFCMMYILIRSWNYFREGKSVGSIVVSKRFDRNGEKALLLPEIV